MTNDDDRKLFLIDGNSLAYRAFFALPDTFITSAGMPSNALFGLAAMFVKIIEENNLPPVVVVWDAGLSGREEIYEEYKAQRDAKPDALREQWPHFIPLAKSFGFDNVRVDGWEADDVIASLAEQAKAADIEVVVVTGDRDALQLADEKVTIMTTARGVTDTKLYDPVAVVERYGIGPELVPDFIGLKGDTSDNIPGVPGIGEKTASQLLQEFGSLEDVLANIENISGTKRKENLTEHADIARLSKQLATMHRDIDTGYDIKTSMQQTFDVDTLRECLREFELREPLRRFERLLTRRPDLYAAGNGGSSVSDDPTTADEFDAVVADAAKKRSSKKPADAVTATARIIPVEDLAKLSKQPRAIVVRTGTSESAGPAGSLLEDAELNAADAPVLFSVIDESFDEVLLGDAPNVESILAAWGERPVVTNDMKEWLGSVVPAVPKLQHDTRIAAYLIDSARRQYEIREMAVQAGISPTTIESEKGTELSEAQETLAQEAAAIAALAVVQRKEIDQLGLAELLDDVELPLVEVLYEMEQAGVKLDVDRLKQISASYRGEIDQLEKDIHELAGDQFTIGSPKQLGVVLFETLGLSKGRKGKTGYSTDARVLASLRDEHPIVEKIEQWRELTKLKNTYIDALPAAISPTDGRLHTTFNQTRAATGRLSSINPNLQNIPVRSERGAQIRACFCAEGDFLLTSADYSQVELRVLAHVAGDEAMQNIFKRGEDVHRATASEVFGVPLDQVDDHMRGRAKAVNFGIIYGLSAFGLSDRLKIPRDEAKTFIDRYMAQFPKVQQFIQDTIEQTKRDGYAVTLLGRRRAIPELASSQHQTRQLGERLAVNTVVQGTAADIIKIAMIRAYRALTESPLKTRLILQIHDELLFEGPADEAEAVGELARREMAGAFELDPPLGVEVGSGANWLEAK